MDILSAVVTLVLVMDLRNVPRLQVLGLQPEAVSLAGGIGPFLIALR